MKRTAIAVCALLVLACGKNAVQIVEDAGADDDAGALTDAGSDAGEDAGPDAGDSGVPDAGADAGPPDGGIPITHVIVIVKENHTFDNYFGSFPGAEGTSTYRLSDGGTGACGHAPQHTLRDLDHSHGAGLTDWNDGGMNGFDLVAKTSVNGDNLAYAQYGEADIPNYWAYARTYTLADHFFSEMIGPSFPGHTMVLAAQAGWALGNPDITSAYWGCDQPVWTRVSVQDQASCQSARVF